MAAFILAEMEGKRFEITSALSSSRDRHIDEAIKLLRTKINITCNILKLPDSSQWHNMFVGCNAMFVTFPS